MELNKKIEKLLAEKDMSQKTLSEKTGIGVSSISRYVTGEIVPSTVVIKKIAKALDVPTSYLVDDAAESVVKDKKIDFQSLTDIIDQYVKDLSEDEKLKIIQQIAKK